VIAGIPIVDGQALQQAIGRVQRAEQSTDEIERQRRQLATERAQAELAASQARVVVSVAQAELAEARSAVASFENTVRRNDDLFERVRRGQQLFADQLSNTTLRAVRADRGIAISIPMVPQRTLSAIGSVPPALREAVSALGERLYRSLPDAFIEVEAYSEAGDQIAARELAEGLRVSLLNSTLRGFRPQAILARGFGRVPVFENGKLTHTVPSGVQIVISSAALGYPPPVAAR
jgi:hypothetical protein